MKKKIILTLLIVLIIFAFTGCSKKKEEKSVSNAIKIIQYKVGTEEIIKEIEITDDESINTLNEYLAKLEPLKPEEQVDLVLAQEISVVYNDNVSVGIQKEENYYCYYINKEKDISSLSKIPSGMYEFVINLIK